MAVIQRPASRSLDNIFLNAATSGTVYSAALAIPAGSHTVTCVASSVAEVNFWAVDGTLITTATTTSGVAAVALSAPASLVTYSVSTGSNIRVGIQLGPATSSGVAAILDTITASGTYTPAAAGPALVLVLGGGGGGAGGTVTPGGGGGGSGFATLSRMRLTGEGVSVTIGAGGTGGPAGTVGGSGGTTTFGALTANGGSGGTRTQSGNYILGGTGGSNGGQAGVNSNYGSSAGGSDGSPGSGVSIATFYPPGVGGTAGSPGGVNPGGGGGVYAGGGGGGGGPNTPSSGGGGGGGGGGVAGSNGSGQAGGAGGAGRVFVMRFTA